MSLYPEHLLPRVYYKKLLSKSIPHGAHFIRFINEVQAYRKEEIQSNCSKILNPSHFPQGCSMNILSVFAVDDVRYKLENTDAPVHAPWEEGMRCYVPNDQEVSVIENRCFCGVDYTGVMNYNAEIDYMDKTQALKSGTASYVFMHAPTLTNFWHYSMYMQITPSDGSKTVICMNNNPLISKSQISKLIVGQLDDLKKFLLEPTELKPCKIERRNYFSALSVLKYIKRLVLKRQ